MRLGLTDTMLLAALVIGGLIVAMSRPENRAANLSEYVMIFIVLVMAAIVVLMFIGTNVGDPWSTINSSLNDV